MSKGISEARNRLQQPRVSPNAVAERIFGDVLEEETEQLDDDLLALIAADWN